MIPEEEAVTEAEEAIVSPPRRAAAFHVTQQQTFNIGLHALTEF